MQNTQTEAMYGTYHEINNQLFEVSGRISEAMEKPELLHVGEEVFAELDRLRKMSQPKERTGVMSWATKLPVVGNMIESTKDRIETENLQKKSIKEGVQMLFDRMQVKQEELNGTLRSLYEIYDVLKQVNTMFTKVHAEATARYNELDSIDVESRTGEQAMELHESGNLATMITSSLATTQQNVKNVQTIIQSGSSASKQIAHMLPNMQAELHNTLAINSGLNTLVEFKGMFDDMMGTLASLNDVNLKGTVQAMEEICSLTVLTGNLEHMQNSMKISNEAHAKQKQLLINNQNEQRKNIKQGAMLVHENALQLEDNTQRFGMLPHLNN
jgi:hypothetical protein